MSAPSFHHTHEHHLYEDHENDIVISEIMWGSGVKAQWIEFYNTTDEDIDLTGWKIHFHRSAVDEGKWENPAPGVRLLRTTLMICLWVVILSITLLMLPPMLVLRIDSRSINTTRLGNRKVGVPPQCILRLITRKPRGPGEKHDVPSGAKDTEWSASVYPTSNLPAGPIGTPGAATIIRVEYEETDISQKLIINEIGNSSNDAYDWVEIYNPGKSVQKIDDMVLTTVWDDRDDDALDPVGKEEILFTFPDLDIPAESYVVFTASDPKSSGNDLAAGIDITRDDHNQQNKGLGSKVGIGHNEDNTTAFYYDTSSRGANVVNLPNDPEKRLYILRSSTKIGSDPGTIGQKNGAQHNVVDVIGSLAIPLSNRTPSDWTGADEEERGRTDTGEAYERRIFNTVMWPLQTETTAKDGKFVDDGAPNTYGGQSVSA